MRKTLTHVKAAPSTLSFTLQVWKEGSSYIAYTPELDLSSCAATLPQAKARLREAVSLFLEEATRLGTLEDILSEAGFQKRGNSYRPRPLLAREKVRLAVPLAC